MLKTAKILLWVTFLFPSLLWASPQSNTPDYYVLNARLAPWKPLLKTTDALFYVSAGRPLLTNDGQYVYDYFKVVSSDIPDFIQIIGVSKRSCQRKSGILILTRSIGIDGNIGEPQGEEALQGFDFRQDARTPADTMAAYLCTRFDDYQQ